MASKSQAATLLIKAGADVNAKGYNGLTPLLKAAHSSGRGGPEIVELLIVWGADVNAKDGDGNTALMRATKSFGSTGREIIELLKASGANR